MTNRTFHIANLLLVILLLLISTALYSQNKALQNISFRAAPIWTNPIFTKIKTNNTNDVALGWNMAVNDSDPNKGYLLLRVESNTWDFAALPTEGVYYSKGQTISSALVIDNIDELRTDSYIDITTINCDTYYKYRLYAYDRTNSSPEYNLSSFAESAAFKLDGVSTPRITSEDLKFSLCNGDSAYLFLRNLENHEDCTFQWYLYDNLIPGETETNLTVWEEGLYYIIVQSETGCRRRSTAINIEVNQVPKVFFENFDTKEEYRNDSTLYFCHEELPTIDPISIGVYDSIVWNKGGKFFRKTNNPIKILLSGTYQATIYNAGCSSTSSELTLNIIRPTLRFSPDSMYFDTEINPLQTLRITNLDSSDILIQKSDFILPTGFSIIAPLEDSFVIIKNNFYEIEIEFSSDEPVDIEDKLRLNTFCEYSDSIIVVGKKRNYATSTPYFSEKQLDFGTLATCQSANQAITVTLDSDEECVIKDYTDNIDGFQVFFNPYLPCKLHGLENKTLEVEISFTGLEPRKYLDTLRLDYILYGEDSKEPIELILFGEKTVPELEILDNSNIFEFEVLSCNNIIDTAILVKNNSAYDIIIKNDFTVQFISFTDLPDTIKPQETKYIPIEIIAGTYEPAIFSYFPCNTRSETISIEIDIVEPEIIFGLGSNDTLYFGGINQCSHPEDTIMNVTYHGNDIAATISDIIMPQDDFNISGLDIGDPTLPTGDFNINFKSNVTGEYLDSIIVILSPCDISKTLFIKGNRFEPEAPTITKDTLDFGELEVDPEFQFQDFTILNYTENELTVTDIIGVKEPFTLLNKDDLNYRLARGSSINYLFTYNPTVASELDTCTITVLYDNGCDLGTRVFLSASAVNGLINSSVEIGFDSLTKMKLDVLSHLSLNINSSDTNALSDLGIKSIHTQIKYDPMVLAAISIKGENSISSAEANLSWQEDSIGIIDVNIDLTEPSLLKEGKLYNIYFLPLLSETLKTDIEVLSYEIISDTAEISVITAKGIVEVYGECNIENKHIDFIYDNNSLEITKKSNNYYNITIIMNNKGYIDVKLFNTMGQIVENIGSGYYNKGLYTRKINTDYLPHGLYFIILKSENGNESYKIFIN